MKNIVGGEKEKLKTSGRNKKLASHEFLAEFRDDLKNYILRIERAISDEIGRYKDSSFYKPLSYAVKGGKRIRPLILILSAESISRKQENSNPYPAAVAIELLHTESLIHDDMIDKESYRRGKPAFHVKYGEPLTILSADFMFAIVLDILAEYREPQILKEVASSVLEMCEGEVKDFKIQLGQQEFSMETYLSLIEKKTASLFSVAAKIGAIIGGGEKWEIDTLSWFGRLFGVSYQIRDDLLDLRKGEKVSDFLRKLMRVRSYEEVKVNLLEMAKKYSRMAIETLKPLRNTKAKECLCELAKFSVLREF
ncbi:MAG: polyprenyl synthetase family protein [Candidatus Hecatellales archaeon]|nr:MAG: polyprenyl synthetase family protein [Candidatus Hecatellales archaeon]